MTEVFLVHLSNVISEPCAPLIILPLLNYVITRMISPKKNIFCKVLLFDLSCVTNAGLNIFVLFYIFALQKKFINILYY